MSSPRQTLKLTASIAELDRLAAFIDAFCAPLSATEEDPHAPQVALDEAFTKDVLHGYREDASQIVELELAHSEKQITATLTDTAPAYDPLARPEVDVSAPLAERQIGGLGVHLLKKLMDQTHYARRDGRNELTLVRNIGDHR